MSTLGGHMIYFIGIGGIGMSGLARYFRRRGAVVAGYDRTPSELTNQLLADGIDVQFDDRTAMIPEEFRQADAIQVMVVRTPAVPLSSPLLSYWEERGARILKRADVLGMITKDLRTVAVAGTHGKTTVSTMIAHLLTVGKVRCNAFLGGISSNYGTNVLLSDDAVVNVVEADEYDRSFLKLCPNESVITAMDPDHMDIYGTNESMFDAYTQFAILCDGPLLVHERIADHFKDRSNVMTYALGSAGVPRAEDLRVVDGAYHFDLITEQHELKDLRLGMPGRHNVENAIAASTIALRLGVTPSSLREGLNSFRGVSRRFETRIRDKGIVYIDDYAHHPKELDACIASVREMYPGRRVTGIFQPHLYSRTRDLAADFAQSLAALDELILLEVYPAREEPIEGIDSTWLLDQVPMENKVVRAREDVIDHLRNKELDVVVTLGAGDIDRLVLPIQQLLNQRIRS
ncbi:MAG: UDP-N-acetylmuramate--L-alanine ligase [Flavobacteriales bacterium]|jgi:UDP-N-acetylmuramate--alanine ligase|nr:UDP-N-acetylmuramate--L-alanine ligase [Flavobacteriales bacterium]MBK6549924.1 UDP-N-acetylmuramate--L-alanine ligase [Flavobacteriales bacterium]MBK6881910.1 UDP-N-acetylmuramate--L-alanine ligase [Flavobacteriales bacterium]MBK7102435.1 UDP-N-acetylmuramate--L-alanine ligase [Flavobacteriales bacterium]MBK7113175.1 UDP-N-acetylmuramate--L-alanine ligase [Flavobacteriales bacterium]